MVCSRCPHQRVGSKAATGYVTVCASAQPLRLSERLTFSVCSFFSLLPNRYISVLRDCRFGVLRCCYLLSSCFARLLYSAIRII